MESTFRLCSVTKRRTTGDSKRLSLPTAGAAGAGVAVATTGAGAAAAATTGAGADSATGAGAASTTGASAAAGGAATTAPASPTTPMTAPTGTVSPSGTRISVKTPATGDGTSVSTLSVDTSNKGSSSATESPTFLNHRVMVPSVTVSPSCGRVTSAMTFLLSPFLATVLALRVQTTAGERQHSLTE